MYLKQSSNILFNSSFVSTGAIRAGVVTAWQDSTGDPKHMDAKALHIPPGVSSVINGLASHANPQGYGALAACTHYCPIQYELLLYRLSHTYAHVHITVKDWFAATCERVLYYAVHCCLRHGNNMAQCISK